MKILIKLLKKFYINRKAYALNEYRYFKKDGDKEYDSFWRIESVIIEGISISDFSIDYSVRDSISFESWGDYSDKVYLTKSGAAKAFSKMKIKPILN